MCSFLQIFLSHCETWAVDVVTEAQLKFYCGIFWNETRILKYPITISLNWPMTLKHLSLRFGTSLKILFKIYDYLLSSPHIPMQTLFKSSSRNAIKTLVYKPQRNLLAVMSAAETDGQAPSVASNSGITPASLESALTEKLEAQFVNVEDISGERTLCTAGDLLDQI